MELQRCCANCQSDFKPTTDWQKCCTPRCTNALRQRNFRAKHRKKGDGGGGGNGGGGGHEPTLFDTITPVDSKAYLVPVIGPSERKPAESVSSDHPQNFSRKAAA